MPSLARQLSGRLVGLRDCHLFALFLVAPGSALHVQVFLDGTAHIEDWSDKALVYGPGLAERQRTHC